MSLNESQQRIADTTEGMIVVDAGPGTGKTHTVVARCINIIRKKDFDPRGLVMLTFTKNAAAEMRERVQKEITKMFNGGTIDQREYEKLTGLSKKMNIGTFDSFCLSIVKQAPFLVSRFFNIKETLTRSADITENESLNKVFFERFLDRFLADRGSDYGDLAAVAAESPEQIYGLINRLMSRGILPWRKTESGRRLWFGGNEGADLVGDTELLRAIMDGFQGLDEDAVDRFKDVPDAMNFDLGSKNPHPRMLDMAANDDRSQLIDMIHDIYFEFIRRSIAEDHLTFGLVASFAFIVLYDDDATRENVSTKYLIVDEFQDTNSNQLMICLMVLKEPNLCVVGDWKQGIYGFRFVSIENITEFERKAVELRRFLNDDRDRIKYHIPEVERLALTENYRSSQLIIDKAYESLLVPGAKNETLDKDSLKERITMIRSARKDIGENTRFECVTCASKEAEVDEVLRRIENYVKSGKYLVCKDENVPPRRPEYRDIAVLTRNTDSARKVYEACMEHNIPAFLQGEVSIMASDEGKLLLAWLRYISNDKDPWGIAAILAHMNYPCSEIKWMMRYDPEYGNDHIPEDLKSFRRSLRGKRRRITELISSVFSYYGLDNDVTQAITAVLSSSHRNTLITISDIIRTMEDDIARDTKYDVDGLPESNAVTIQTMHKSKGLEYPIVILPRIDQRTFPSPQDDKDLFTFSDLTGIRCRKEVIRFGEGEKKVGDSWKSAVVRKSLKSDYSEERRLLFVAISRAKQYVTMISGNRPSQFFQHFAGTEVQQGGTGPIPLLKAVTEELIPRPVIERFEVRRKSLSVHDLLDFTHEGHRPDGDTDEFSGRGMQYGTEVHRLAELIVKGLAVDETDFTDYPQLVYIRSKVEELKAAGAELSAEVTCTLPLDDPAVTLNGVIDMIAEFGDHVEVHDWKTDVDTTYEGEYKVQLSIYAHVLAHVYGKPVACSIDWATPGRSEVFEPLGLEHIAPRARRFLEVE